MSMCRVAGAAVSGGNVAVAAMHGSNVIKVAMGVCGYTVCQCGHMGAPMRVCQRARKAYGVSMYIFGRAHKTVTNTPNVTLTLNRAPMQ